LFLPNINATHIIYVICSYYERRRNSTRTQVINFKFACRQSESSRGTKISEQEPKIVLTKSYIDIIIIYYNNEYFFIYTHKIEFAENY